MLSKSVAGAGFGVAAHDEGRDEPARRVVESFKRPEALLTACDALDDDAASRVGCVNGLGWELVFDDAYGLRERAAEVMPRRVEAEARTTPREDAAAPG